MAYYECGGNIEEAYNKGYNDGVAANGGDFSTAELIGFKHFGVTTTKSYKYVFIASGYIITTNNSNFTKIVWEKLLNHSGGGTMYFYVLKSVSSGVTFNVSSSATVVGMTVIGIP